MTSFGGEVVQAGPGPVVDVLDISGQIRPVLGDVEVLIPPGSTVVAPHSTPL